MAGRRSVASAEDIQSCRCDQETGTALTMKDYIFGTPALLAWLVWTLEPALVATATISFARWFDLQATRAELAWLH